MLSQQHLPIDERHYADINGTVLSFDYGEKRVGVAVGETVTKIANALTTIKAEVNDVRFAEITKLLKEWQPQLLVVGLPTYLDGKEHEVTQLAKKFARRLEGRFDLPVIMIDERLSSAEASQHLSTSGKKSRDQKALIDAVAAQVILQSYFDRLQTTLNNAAT